MKALALIVAAGSIAWLGWQIETTRKQETEVPQPAPALPALDLASLAPPG
jgi:hypothetical protein